MKTIKLALSTPELDDLRRIQSSIIRRAFVWQTKKGIAKLNEPRLQPQDKLSGHLIRSAIIRAQWLSLQDHPKQIFGGRGEFIRRCKGLITNKEWKLARIHPLFSVGQANQKGNTKFKLNNGFLIYKDQWNTYRWPLPRSKPAQQAVLHELEEKAQLKQLALTFSVGPDYVCISFDEQKLDYYRNKYRKYKSNPHRSLGIDLNPDRIAITILDRERIIHAEIFELTARRNQNRRRQTVSEVGDAIYRIVSHYRCARIVTEDLNIKTKDHGKGRQFNRQVNFWIRNFILQKIKSICDLTGIDHVGVNAAYSSFVGNLQYPHLGDPCGPAAEIARRGLHKYKKGKFYPALIARERLVHRWKETADLDFTYDSWVELYQGFKERRLGWRSPTDTSKGSRFSHFGSRVLVSTNLS